MDCRAGITTEKYCGPENNYRAQCSFLPILNEQDRTFREVPIAWFEKYLLE